MAEYPWQELSELCAKIRNNVVSEGIQNKLDELLQELPDSPQAILWNEAKAMQAEFHADFRNAIAYRREEISLMSQLQMVVDEEIHKESVAEYALSDRTASDLKNRHEILEELKGRLRGTDD